MFFENIGAYNVQPLFYKYLVNKKYIIFQTAWFLKETLLRVDQIEDRIYNLFESNEHSWFLQIYKTTVEHQILIKDLEVY